MSNTRLSLQQAVAALSVVLSLVFVGYEIRQNTQVARGAAVEASIDQTRYTWVVVSTVRITENRFRQMQMGVIDDGDLGIGGGTSNKSWFRSPYFLEWCASADRTQSWAPDFLEFFETEVLGLR
jgi:hypothetical protein